MATPHEGQQEQRRPAQQPVVAVDEQRHQPVGALQVAERERRRRWRSRRPRRRCRASGPPYSASLMPTYSATLKNATSAAPTRQRPPARAEQRAGGEQPDHDARRARTSCPARAAAPSSAKQPNAARRETRSSSWTASSAAPTSSSRRGQLGVDRGARRPGTAGRPPRPAWRRAPTGRAPPAAPAGRLSAISSAASAARNSSTPLAPPMRVRGRDQQREADAVRLVQEARWSPCRACPARRGSRGRTSAPRTGSSRRRRGRPRSTGRPAGSAARRPRTRTRRTRRGRCVAA